MPLCAWAQGVHSWLQQRPPCSDKSITDQNLCICRLFFAFLLFLLKSAPKLICHMVFNIQRLFPTFICCKKNFQVVSFFLSASETDSCQSELLAVNSDKFLWKEREFCAMCPQWWDGWMRSSPWVQDQFIYCWIAKYLTFFHKKQVAGLLKNTFSKAESNVFLRRREDQFNRFNFMP